MQNLKYFALTSLALFVVGCSSNYSSDKTGKEVLGTADSKINQVCVDGVLYLSTGRYATPQQDLNGSFVGCSIKPEVVISQIKENQKDKDLSKLTEKIKNDIKDSVTTEVKSEVVGRIKSKVNNAIRESIKDINNTSFVETTD